KTRDGLRLPRDAAAIRAIAFYAIPPGRTHSGLTPIYQASDALQREPPAPGAAPLCYGLPPDAPAPTGLALTDRTGKPLAVVWKNPQSILALDFSLTPTPELSAGAPRR